MKKIISICLMLCLFVTIGSVFVGCEKNYSADDISVYYNQITQTNEETKQFFVANQLKVDFKTNNESVKTSFDDPTSPAYILNIVYEPMATASMKFLSAKIDISNIKALTNDMTQEARNNIYVNLQNLDASLQEFAKIKGIYERSDGTLQFTKLLTAYNKVIDSSFALNFEFADNYYLNTKGIGYKDFSVEDLTITDTDIKDMMYYNNMILAKIVFDFSVKTYEPSNPLTSIDNWYNTETYMTTYLHNYLTLAKISANIGVSQTVLTSLMRKSFDCSVMEYVKKYRILVAKKQLAFTDVPIKDIANMVGFKTVQHFGRVFKEHTGATPADYRKTSVEKRKKEL